MRRIVGRGRVQHFQLLVLVLVDLGQLVRMAMTEYEEANEIYCQADTTDDKKQLRLLQLFLVKEALDGFNENAEAEREKEDGVDEGAKDLGSHPSKGVLFGFPLGELQIKEKPLHFLHNLGQYRSKGGR